MEKPSISFIAMNFILLFAVIGFILIVFDLQGYAFVFELGILLIFMFFLTLAMFVIYHNKNWGWILLGATLILILINTLFIIFIKDVFEIFHITIMFFSVLGLVVTLINVRIPSQEVEEGEFGKVEGYYHSIDKIKPKEPAEPKVEKTFTPGKYIASKKANKFHLPKCDWALKISKVNRMWFNSEEEAKAKGFEADKCVG